jgi:hypothetical protein
MLGWAPGWNGQYERTWQVGLICPRDRVRVAICAGDGLKQPFYHRSRQSSRHTQSVTLTTYVPPGSATESGH